MIAVITSTIYPPAGKSYFNHEERLEQTKKTISALQQFDFQEILLFDNSPSLNQDKLDKLLAQFPLIKSFHNHQYTFENKGLNEALLLLNNIHHIPEDIPVFKISGRYYPVADFKLIDTILFNQYDIIGAGTDFDKKISGFNTRGYFIKDAEILRSTLVLAIEDMLSYANGIHGPKSLFAAIKNSFRPWVGVSYQLSMEQAFARILKLKKNYLLLKKLNIEGYVAGSDYLDLAKD